MTRCAARFLDTQRTNPGLFRSLDGRFLRLINILPCRHLAEPTSQIPTQLRMCKDVREHAALYCIATVSVELCCLSRASFLFVRETVFPTIIKTTRLSVSDRNGRGRSRRARGWCCTGSRPELETINKHQPVRPRLEAFKYCVKCFILFQLVVSLLVVYKHTVKLDSKVQNYAVAYPHVHRTLYITGIRITVSTVVLNCCKGDRPSQWETPIFGPL